jgi:glutamyl/glutaminyl-tRNA synthetase
MSATQFNTRIAPSPTGDMHIGTARTAYFNWLAARSTGGKFILRIDDTDTERSKPEYTDIILKTMDWLGLDYDPPYTIPSAPFLRQSEKFDAYQLHAKNMLKNDFAYEYNGSIMLKLGDRKNLPDFWYDEIAGEIPITKHDRDITDGICLIRANGTATYNFASVIDDMNHDINYIIRGVDHTSNTSKQVIIWHILSEMYQTISWRSDFPKFAHIGLIHHNKTKLSKRDGAASMLYYREKGYDPDAMLNFLARLGWGPKTDDKTTAMLPRERMLELFMTGGNLKNSTANMDLAKLEAYDRKYKAKKGIWRNKDRLVNE